MMFRIPIFLLTAVAMLAAPDPWSKVRELKSGAEVRIYKTGAKQPLAGKFDELRDESIVIVLKNEQVAIAKDQIDRIDARPPQTGSRVTKETRTTVKDMDTSAAQAGPARGAPGTSTSTSTGYSIGSRPDFQTIYQRKAAPPRK